VDAKNISLLAKRSSRCPVYVTIQGKWGRNFHECCYGRQSARKWETARGCASDCTTCQNESNVMAGKRTIKHTHWHTKSKLRRILRQPSPKQIMRHQKQVENVECFKYLGCRVKMMQRDTWIKSKIARANAEFKKKALFTRILELYLRKKLVKCYTWSKNLYGAETWLLREVDQKYLDSFEMWWEYHMDR